MKVALAFAAPWRSGSIDFPGLCSALTRLGHLPILVCCSNACGEANFPVVEASAQEMMREAFWRNLNLEAVIFFDWLRAPNIVVAMKRANLRVLSRADMDGQASVKVFPRAAWLASVSGADGPADRLRRIKHWMHRYLSLSRIEDNALLETIEHSDAVAIECKEAAGNIRRILRYYRRSDLADKLHVVPHSVSDRFLTAKIQTDWRPRRIVCASRWSDPQKDPQLLAATIAVLLRRRADLEVVIVGGAGDLFALLVKRYPQVHWRRHLPHEQIPSMLENCRCILSSSRWESYPIIALEALCMGCTVVAPPLPGYLGIVENGRYGTISLRRNAYSLARAVELEMELWDNRARAPIEISAAWRKRVSNDSVIFNLVSLIS
jgi:glycosyltransferase involved in cell wall biosynthesis